MNDSNGAIEYEKTYLAKYIPPEVKNSEPIYLYDLYIPEAADRPYVRLRQLGDKYEIMKKKPIASNDFSIQSEQTITLNKAEFDALSKASKRRVSKNRYRVIIEGNAAEVDVFWAEFEGLVMLDFEFENEQELNAFKPPDCCLADVTQELFVAGGQLAGSSYRKIEKNLTRFGYKPLHFSKN